MLDIKTIGGAVLLWLNNWSEDVIRAKGMIWIETRNQIGYSISQAGPSIQLGTMGYWIATLPQTDQIVEMDED